MPDFKNTNSTLTIDEYGNKQWYLPNGNLHREDGPAIEYADGEKEWFLNDKELTEDQFLDWKFVQWATTPVEYVG